MALAEINDNYSMESIGIPMKNGNIVNYTIWMLFSVIMAILIISNFKRSPVLMSLGILIFLSVSIWTLISNSRRRKDGE